jgi:hypothetical protein
MALYFGGSKRKIYLNNILFNLNIYSSMPIIIGILLKSSNDYILKDSNGLYLTAKESE